MRFKLGSIAMCGSGAETSGRSLPCHTRRRGRDRHLTHNQTNKPGVLPTILTETHAAISLTDILLDVLRKNLSRESDHSSVPKAGCGCQFLSYTKFAEKNGETQWTALRTLQNSLKPKTSERC